MAITFYYASGSTFAWYVWFVLEHKQLSYDMKVFSFREDDMKTPEYLAINPRGKVPVLIDEGFVLWESSAIVEYLEEHYPERPVLPGSSRSRATARRIVSEASCYLYPPLRGVMEQILWIRPDGDAAPAALDGYLQNLHRELVYFEGELSDDFFAGSLSIADFAMYPLLALVNRLQERQPQHNMGSFIGPRLAAFMGRIEQLPYFTKTIPPHWKG